jgi:hypothetical protein
MEAYRERRMELSSKIIDNAIMAVSGGFSLVILISHFLWFGHGLKIKSANRTV